VSTSSLVTQTGLARDTKDKEYARFARSMIWMAEPPEDRQSGDGRVSRFIEVVDVISICACADHPAQPRNATL